MPARLNPLLKLPEIESGRLSTADRIHTRHVTDSSDVATRICDSAILDTRILESRAWPHMYLTDPPCTCAHIDIEYAVPSRIDAPILRVRRRVYDPAGVTFGAIYDALHERGLVTTYHGRQFFYCPSGTSDTTTLEQLQILEQNDLRLSLTPEKAIVEFCHLVIATDANSRK